MSSTATERTSGSLRRIDRIERGYWSQVAKNFARHRPALIGAGLIVLFSLGAIFAPWITSFDPNKTDVRSFLQGPSSTHLMGTDDLGRDLFTRVLFGGRVSLTIGVLAMSIALVVGTLIGALAGFYGGVIDNLLMRLTDAAIAFPRLFLLILFAALFGTKLSTIVLVIGLLSWTHLARLTRASFLSIKEKEFIEAARAIGVPSYRIMFRHILPNALGPIIVASTLGVAAAIITESSLSYLGLGVQPPTATWGSMLRNAQQSMVQAPWTAIFPGLMIFLTVLAINFIGDGLRDALDPRRPHG